MLNKKKIVDKYLLRTPCVSYPESKVVCITFKELKELNKILKIPEFQTDLDENKVEEMIESYKKNQHHFSSRCLITIAHNIIGDKEEYLVVDGQHRIEMAINLLEQHINNTLLIAIIDVKSRAELEKLFQDINKDSAKCLTNYYGIFEKQMYEEVKILINNTYKFLPSKSSSKNSLYTSSEFTDLLIQKNILSNISNKLNTTNAEEIFIFISSKEKQFFNEIEYLEQYHTNKDNFKLSETKSIEALSCMFIKNNNFLEYLIDDTVLPVHNYKKRQSISKELQKEVWNKQFESKTSGKCPIYKCTNILSLDISNSWQCGHIISLYNGGTIESTNLKPICPTCNQSMSSTNWNEWVEQQMSTDIISDYFEDPDDTVKCKIKNCKNKITINNFKPYLSGKTKKPKPICTSCYNN